MGQNEEAIQDEVAAGDKEIVDVPEEGYPLPPLFVSDDGGNANTTQHIDTVLVSKKNEKTKRLDYIDWRPVEQMSTLDQLLEQFGPGEYLVSGRLLDRRTIVRARMVSVGATDVREAQAMLPPQPREFNFEKLATGIAAAVAPVLAFVTSMMERGAIARDKERELDRQRISEDRARTEAMFEKMMTMVTTTLGARHEDTGALVQALLSAKTESPGGGPTEAKAYKEGQADALEMLAALKEGGVLGPDSETQVIDLLKSFAAGANEGKKATLPAAPPASAEPAAL